MLYNVSDWFQEPEPVVIQRPSSMAVTVEPEGLFAGSPLIIQPQLEVYDTQVSVLTFFLLPPWQKENYVFGSPGLSVCLSEHYYSTSYKRIALKVYGEAGVVQGRTD